MKKLLAVIGLVIAAFSFQASAATKDLGTIEDSAFFGNKISVAGSFSDTWNFSTNFDANFSGDTTNSYVSIKTTITDFFASLDGHAFKNDSSSGHNYLTLSLANLAAGAHKLVISGISGGSASYSGNIAVAQTPIPAAVWLFGSALMGLMSARRKKA